MAQKKTRLQRKPVGGMKEKRLELSKSMMQLSNKQVEAYAASKARDPIGVSIKQAALDEVARRNRILQKWKRGAPTKQKKKGKPLLPKPKELVKESVKGVQKGVGFLGKAISGELARELEEDISTIGMSKAEKKKYFAKRIAAEKQRLAEDRKEEAEMRRLGFG